LATAARAAALLVGVSVGAELPAQTGRLSADASASAGIASNPFLGQNDSSVTAFIEAGFYPRYVLTDELGSTAIELNYRRTEYLDDQEASQSYGGSVRSQRRLSEQVSLGGLVSFDSSILGERGSNILVPVQLIDPGAPEVPVVDPDLALFGLGQRQNRLRAAINGEYRSSDVDAFNAEASVEKTSFSGGNVLTDYRTFAGSIGYSRSLSEVTRAGARIGAQFIDYDQGSGSSLVLTPQLTLDTRLSPLWTLTAAAGLLFVRTEREGESSDSFGLSATVSGCRQGDRSYLCLFFQRDASPSGLGEVVKRSAASLSYSYRLNTVSSIRANVDVSRVEESELVGREALTYGSVTATYDREITRRLTGGVSAAYRDVYGSDLDRSADISGQVFIRARLGSLQ
jgi:hypothetical protein